MIHAKLFQRAGLVLLAAPLLLLLVVRPFDRRLGLNGTYFARPDFSGARFSRIDYQISTDALAAALQYAANRPFAVTWAGLLAVEHPGSYRFEIVSDDGSTVRLDDQWLIDIGGPHGPLAGRGTRQLDAGLHPIQIDFFEAGGGWKIELFWARDDAELTRIPATALLHEPMGMAQYTLLRRAASLAALVPIFWILGGVMLLLNLIWRKVWFQSAKRELSWPPIAAVLILSFLLSAIGVWWGFPDGWAPDEVGPGDVLGGLSQFFSAGWYTRYPPFQFYLLGIFAAPFKLADLIRPSDANAQNAYVMLFIVNRLVSVLMGTGTIAAVYFSGLRLARDPRHARLGGLLAAATMAVVLPFVYYAKVANLDVPYLFWFGLAMYAYIRILQDAPASAYRLFALTATLAVCTKDQAYGFFLLPALHAAVRRYQQLRSGPSAIGALVTDRVLWSSMAIAIAAFVIFDNLIFNFAGFVEHVRVITGGASVGYQMVPATMSGRMQLLSDVFRLLRWSLGWPLFLLSAAALVTTAVMRDKALWLLLPAFSYYLTFLNVVLYAYDRFLLGLCLILAIILGCRLAEWVSARGARRFVAVALALAGFGRGLLYAASLDAMMVRDSRYATQHWFKTAVPRDALITLIGRREYLPVLDGFTTHYMEPPQLTGFKDYQYVVVNVKYMGRFKAGEEAHTLYQQMRRGDGYSLVLREGPALPWAPLARDPVFLSQEEDPYTNLTKVDPQIEVYRRKN